MTKKIVIREGIEFVIEDRIISIEVYSPRFMSIAAVSVSKPEMGRSAEVNWISCACAVPEVAREMAIALQVGADIAASLTRGFTN